MNKLFLVSMVLLLNISFLKSQTNFRIDISSGIKLKKARAGSLLLAKDSPLDGVCLESRLLILNESIFVHGPSFSYVLAFNNIDYLNSYYFEDRSTGFPPESWLPDTISSMTQAHQFALSYDFGLEKIVKEKHVVTLLFSIGAILHKLPNRIDQYQGQEYLWKKNLYGGITGLTIGYAFLFDSKQAIQLSSTCNQIILTKDSYENYGFTMKSFQLNYSAKVGYLRYF